MKSIFLTTIVILSSSFSVMAGEYSQARGQHTETQSYLAVDSCRSARNIIIDLAVKNCEVSYKKCQSKSSIVLENRPVTDPMLLNQGWRRICKVTSTAVEVDQSKRLEVGLGYGGSYCQSQSGHFNALISRLGFGMEIVPYSRCDSENYNYDIGGEIVFGLSENSQHGQSIASKPIKFKKLKDCLKSLHGELFLIKSGEMSVSAGNRNFGLSLFCEKAEKRGYQLSGTVSHY